MQQISAEDLKFVVGGSVGSGNSRSAGPCNDGIVGGGVAGGVAGLPGGAVGAVVGAIGGAIGGAIAGGCTSAPPKVPAPPSGGASGPTGRPIVWNDADDSDDENA